MAILIFLIPGVSSVPWNGLALKDSLKRLKSDLIDLYFFAKAFKLFLKSEVAVISKLIEKFVYRVPIQFTFPDLLHLIKPLTNTCGQGVFLCDRKNFKGP